MIKGDNLYESSNKGECFPNQFFVIFEKLYRFRNINHPRSDQKKSKPI